MRRYLYAAPAALALGLALTTPAYAGGDQGADWNLTSMCKPDKNTGKFRVTGPAGESFTVKKYGTGQVASGTVGDGGTTTFTVTYGSSSDTYKLMHNGEQVSVKAIGNNALCDTGGGDTTEPPTDTTEPPADTEEPPAGNTTEPPAGGAPQPPANDGTGDIDCADVTHAEAVDILNQDPSDPNRLDADDDGIPCEVPVTDTSNGHDQANEDGTAPTPVPQEGHIAVTG